MILVDKESGILVKFEGKDSTRQKKKYCQEFGAATAITLRLLEPYFGTNRLVYIDSWFKLVKTAVKLKKKRY